MTDGHVAHERAQRVLVEDLGDEALVADAHDVAAGAGGGDARRLLAPVLEREQGKVGETGDVVAGGVDPEDAALIAGAVAEVGHERGHQAKHCGKLGWTTAKASSGPATPRPLSRNVVRLGLQEALETAT